VNSFIFVLSEPELRSFRSVNRSPLSTRFRSNYLQTG